jgi:hypothetical protein
MTVRTDLENALESWTNDGNEAFILVEKIFSRVRALLFEQLQHVSYFKIDLLLADLQRDTREDLFNFLHNTVDRDAAVDIIASRFFGED